jgi:hypothetical protein
VTTTAPQMTNARGQSATARPTASPRRLPASSDRRTWGTILLETVPIIDAPAFFGPPIIFVLGPWLLLVLLLTGAFALIVTVVFVLALAFALMAALAVVLASPFLLVRHRRTHRVVHPKRRAALHWLANHQGGSVRLGSPQTTAHRVEEASHA